MNRIGIIGGGASGMIAASFCKNSVLIEKNEKLGKKVYITGKGRCNVTNNCAVYEFLPHVVRGGKFMQSSLSAFPPQDLMGFLFDNGLRTKTERGGRVFPISDKSSDVIKTLSTALQKSGTTVKLNTEVLDVQKVSDVFHVKTSQGEFEFDKLIIATGGLSYKSTGSTGDGYDFAKKFGHSIITPVPALSPIRLLGNVEPLQGLSLKNVRASVTVNGKTFSEFGEMLFTDVGVSGPIILTLSSRVNRFDLKGLSLVIDFKPALSPETLDARLSGDFVEFHNKDLSNILTELLPKSVIPYVLGMSGVSGNKKGNSITKQERYAIGYSVKNLNFIIRGLADIDEAIVTSGGVDLKEINPKTMESKLVRGLYFVGEMLDVDSHTGGYNLQCAFSTGRAAGISASEEL